jgi:hypothetical protein
VFFYEDGDKRGQNFIRLIEAEVQRADLFVALVSPNYLTSYWCRKERDLALTQEGELRRQFVYIFHVVKTLHANTGFIRTVDWVDLLPPVHTEKLQRAVATLALDPCSTRSWTGHRNPDSTTGGKKSPRWSTP